MLNLAFEIASSIPADPHERDRARMQEDVAVACLDEAMLERAVEIANAMAGWRRAEVLVLAAQRYAVAKDDTRARALVARAQAEASTDHWSHERIMAAVAKVHLQLGDDASARALSMPESPADQGAVEVARTASVAFDQLDVQADMFDRAIATQNFDLARTGIDGYLVWMERVVNDPDRWARATKALDAGIPDLPRDLQVVYTVRRAELLWKLGLSAAAREQVSAAADVFSSTEFQPEDCVPIGIAVARARIDIGDLEGAAQDLRTLRAQYEVNRASIVDLRRATSLRALAEAYAKLGDRPEAVRCFAIALDEGARNPNARPRAMDLTATCLSMVRAGVLPSPELQVRIDSIRVALTDPW